MFKKIKNLNPETKSMLTAAAVITAINVVAIVVIKQVEKTDEN